MVSGQEVDFRDPQCAAELGAPLETALAEAELVRGAGAPFERDAFLGGRQTPVLFGSAIDNFGVQEVLDALVAFGPSQSASAGETTPRSGTQPKLFKRQS